MAARSTEEKGRSRSNCTVPSSVDSWLLAGLFDCLFISGRHFQQLRKDLEMAGILIMRRGRGKKSLGKQDSWRRAVRTSERPFRPFCWSAAKAGAPFVSRALKMSKCWSPSSSLLSRRAGAGRMREGGEATGAND
jgi:hypothetical protein